MFQGVECAVEKNINTEAPFVTGGGGDRPYGTDNTGTVKNNIQLAKAFHSGVDGAGHILFDGDVTVLIERLVAKGRCKCFASFVLNVANTDGAALGDKTLYRCRTKSAGTASDKSKFVGQSHDGCISFFETFRNPRDGN